MTTGCYAEAPAKVGTAKVVAHSIFDVPQSKDPPLPHSRPSTILGGIVNQYPPDVLGIEASYLKSKHKTIPNQICQFPQVARSEIAGLSNSPLTLTSFQKRFHQSLAYQV